MEQVQNFDNSLLDYFMILFYQADTTLFDQQFLILVIIIPKTDL